VQRLENAAVEVPPKLPFTGLRSFYSVRFLRAAPRRRSDVEGGRGLLETEVDVPALPYPKYGLSNLYLFPYYQTREDYERAVGQAPPPWDPNRPPKYWFDPNARQSTRRNVVYDFVIATSESGTPLVGSDGKPMLDLLVLPKEEAATVNIPPKDVANVPGADRPEVPCPLRALEPDEELFFDFGGIVAVKNKNLYPSLEVGFTAEDRALLRAIAAKLGVSL